MNTVWWTKVTNASHFLDKIVDTMQNEQSVILYLPDTIPWYLTMREIVEDELIRQNSTSSYKYVLDSGEEPGEYLFRKFCKEEKRRQYRPGIGYAEFLAKSEDIVLNDSILWISVAEAKQLEKWASFIDGYNRALGRHKKGCIFLIETRNHLVLQGRRGIINISYTKEIERYDNYLFNMLATSNLREPESFKQYLAEAIFAIIPDDIELSALCIAYGREFLEAPLQVISNIIATKFRSDGSQFEIDISENKMQERLWEAQIKTIFPLVEKHRNSIIQKYHKRFEALLPINTSYGEVFEEANDIELGTISYLVGSGKLKMSYEDVNKVTKLKKVRNILAHIRSLSQKDVDEIFSLG